MKRILSLLLAVASVMCMMTFITVDASAAKSDELVLQDIKYKEVINRVNQMDSGFTRSSTGIAASGVTASTSPRDDFGWQFYYINLSKYSTDAGGQDREIDEVFLNYLDKSLANLRKNGGNTMIRCCYDWDGNQQREPQTFELLLTHQTQLASVFSKYPDVISLVECGMIGAFGEMWGGKYSRSVYKAQVLDGWLTQLPEEITINVRTSTEYIYYVNDHSELYDTKYRNKTVSGVKYPEVIEDGNFAQYPFYNTIFSRIGCYNDAMIQNENDGGSFTGRRINFNTWLGWKSKVTSYGGEFSGAREYRVSSEIWLPYNAIPEFYESHLSYYHGGNNAYAYTGEFKYESTQTRSYPTEKEAELRRKEFERNMTRYGGDMSYSASTDGLVNTFTTGGWSSATMTDDLLTHIEETSGATAQLRDYYGVSVAQFFEDHVGYRIVLRESYLNENVPRGGVLTVKGSVDNTGFANITREKVTEIVITDGKNTYTVATDVDARKWYSATRSDYNVEIKLPSGIPAGEYTVYMRVAGQAPDGTTNEANCVRFCNPGDFSYNVLGSDYSVGSSTVALIYDSDVCANYLGTFTVTEDTLSGSDDSIRQVYTTFTDTEGHWAEDEIFKICLQGLMTGVAPGKFAPETVATRAQVVTILYRMEGSPDVSDVETPLEDISGSWYTDAVKWAYKEEIVNGTTPTTFSPNTKLNRETFATMMYRYAQYKGVDVESVEGDLSKFTDKGKVSGWALEAMKWANAKGYITGMTPTTIVPQGKATRAQMATILTRYLEV